MEDSAIKATPVNHLVYSVNPSFFAFGRGVGMYETWIFISSTHFFICRVFRAHLARIPLLTFETKKRLQHHFIVRRMGKKKVNPFRAHKSLLAPTSSKIVPEKGFPDVMPLSSPHFPTYSIFVCVVCPQCWRGPK